MLVYIYFDDAAPTNLEKRIEKPMRYVKLFGSSKVLQLATILD
jgi:hypothetical protein